MWARIGGLEALLAMILFVVVAVAFLPSLRNGFVNYDDPQYITENPHVRAGLTWEGFGWAWTTAEAANWHPLTWLSHSLDAQIFGLRAWGHHLTGILLHAVNASLLFLVFRQMTGANGRSFFVAALFGLHPLRVESVAWASERKDVLCAFFWLLALWAYACYVQEQKHQTPNTKHQGNFKSGGQKRDARTYYALALAFFTLGLLSKPMVVTLPFVLLLLDYWPLGRISDLKFEFSDWKPLVVEKVPFFLLAAMASVVTFLAQSGGGAVKGLSGLALTARLENALVAYCRYLGKMFWPADLSVFYPRPAHWPAAVVAGAALALCVLTMTVIKLRARQPWLAVGWFWFLGTLVPVIGLVQVGEQAMADRYTYLPMVGVLVMLVWSVGELLEVWRVQNVAAGFCGGVLMIGCVVLTQRQIQCWRNSESLFRHALAATGENYVACWHLADFYAGQSSAATAEEMYRRTLDLAPGCMEAHDSFGKLLLDQKRYSEAMDQFETALRLRPGHARAHCNKGVVLYRTGRIDEAIAEFQEATNLDPDYADAHNNLGNALLGKGRAGDGIRQLETGIRLNPGDTDAQFNLGAALESQGRLDEAILRFKQVTVLQPGDASAHNSLGAVLGKQGRLEEAIGELEQAVRLDPGSAEAQCNLGLVLAAKGRREEAVRHLKRALDLQPDYSVAARRLQTLSGATDH